MNEIFGKILPYEARAEFCQIFRSFGGQWSFKKKCFWDLLTFKNVRGATKRISQVSRDSRYYITEYKFLGANYVQQIADIPFYQKIHIWHFL